MVTHVMTLDLHVMCDVPGCTQVPLGDRAAQASSSLVQYDKNRNLARLLSSAGMVGAAMPGTHGNSLCNAW
jgi:hypothetical protein